MQPNALMRPCAKSVMLVSLFLAALGIESIGIGKRAGVAIGHKARDHDIVTGPKLNAMELCIPFAYAIQIDKRVHA